ncbi:hypothetical protein HHK36_024969 [Tetracentron sinense]|uniref:PX domain-containing protein n=1 Tax=Tetracentron sinense TaxID=13715 RepID=A0A834YQ09_TETSI|nr:hypothetical protein HHK36_024969 [Tetracentron sinense]
MINGEGTQDNISDVASPEPFDGFSPWAGRNMDDGNASPVSPNYSSCGESELDKYCSANSVMGSASFCSSLGTCNEFLDSDLGSARSLGLGEDSILENFGVRGRIDKRSGDRGIVSLGGFDCLPDGRIEFHNERNDTEKGISVEGRGLLRIRSGSKSLLNTEENSSSYGVTCEECNDDTTTLKVGGGSELLKSSDVNNSQFRGLFDEDDGEGLIPSRDLCRSGLSLSSRNISSQETSGGNNEENLFKFGLGNGSHSLQGSKEESPSYTPVCEEGFSEQVHGDVGCFHRSTSEFGAPSDVREFGRFPEAEEETSSRYENSEDEGSMYNYGTDDEDRMEHGRNLKYHQKAEIKNENPLFINSSIAYGSDDWDDFMQVTEESNLTLMLLDKPQKQQQEHLKAERNLPNSTPVAPIGSPVFGGSEQEESVRDIHVTSFNVPVTDESAEYLESCSVRNIFASEMDPPPVVIGLDIMDDAAERELQCISTQVVTDLDDRKVPESELLVKSKVRLDPLSDITVSQLCSTVAESPQDQEAGFLEDYRRNVSPSMFENNCDFHLKRIVKDSYVSVDPREDHLASTETENFELNESYDEFVHELEEILLDSGESPGTMFAVGPRVSPFQQPLPFRDGSSTASTSGTDDAHPPQYQLRIDGVEVVGAKQKKGDVSFGERLVGIKEYTVYKLRVWSGNDEWEVERRYRDFCTFYRQLKTFYADQGWSLPSPWSSVERESRKIFGNASPDVIAERSALIQECLRSILNSVFSSSSSSSLIWFLSPQKVLSSSSTLNTLLPRSTSGFSGGTSTEGVSTLGKTISLIVEIRPSKSMKQLLEAQHYTCAGCHKHFNDGKTLMREFAQTIGWGNPRLCEYTSQLFCASCHTNDTAVLPARVLHLWDFTQYPVSQLAKSYLESIHDQPMLCVSAVNPFLFSKVPSLLHVMGIRKKIGAMLPYVRCPFRRSINRGLGSRRYLLESNDFFALRDLVDLSKGAFAALPVMVESVSRKILEHITEQCLICCDVGLPCGARQACEDPSSLIFPFQEGEVEKCSSCESFIHKPCFRKLTSCPCGAHLEVDEGAGPTDGVKRRTGNDIDGASDMSERDLDSRSPVRFLSGLFSKGRQEKKLGARNSNPVLLMGSLPSTTL